MVRIAGCFDSTRCEQTVLIIASAQKSSFGPQTGSREEQVDKHTQNWRLHSLALQFANREQNSGLDAKRTWVFIASYRRALRLTDCVILSLRDFWFHYGLRPLLKSSGIIPVKKFYFIASQTEITHRGTSKIF